MKARQISILASTILPLLAACDLLAPAQGEATTAGAAAALEAVTEDIAVGDTIAGGLLAAPGTRQVTILIAWGALQPQPEIAESVDWTGSISVENAALRVVRIVRKDPFEGQDVVLLPRTDIRQVAFQSHIRRGSDGLLVQVIEAPALNPGNGLVTLSFNTAPFSDSLVIEPGMLLAQVRPVDDAGHVVAYTVLTGNGNEPSVSLGDPVQPR
jgi:hypothetical protein